MKSDKATLRQHIRQLHAKYTTAQLQAMSTQLVQALEAHPYFLQANTVLLYHSLPDEPQTHELIKRWGERKRILLPVVRDNDMVLRQYTSNNTLHTGTFGISEPQGTDYTDYTTIQLAVVPGIAFDADGNRLGRGRGYYDRFFAAMDIKAWRMGYCYPFQLVEHVPTDAQDISMHEVLTLPYPHFK